MIEEGKKAFLLETGSHSIQQIKARLNRFCMLNEKAPILLKINSETQDPDTLRLSLAGAFAGISAGLSMWISNTTAAAMMLPIGVAILSEVARRQS